MPVNSLLGGGASQIISENKPARETPPKKISCMTPHDCSVAPQNAWYIMYLPKTWLIGSSLKEIDENCGNPKHEHVSTSIFTWWAEDRKLLWHTDMVLPLTQTQPVHERNDESPNTASPTPYRSCCFNVTCSPVNGSSSHSVHHMSLEIQIEGHKVKKNHTAKHHAASMCHVVYCCDVFFTNKKAGESAPSFSAI